MLRLKVFVQTFAMHISELCDTRNLFCFFNLTLIVNTGTKEKINKKFFFESEIYF